MGKKNKKEKKEKGSEKTARKSEKKMEKKIKKSRTEAGEEDIEILISKFKEEDRKKTEVVERKCDPPSPRVNFSFTANRAREEIYLFGGEYDDGSKTAMYNDFLTYSCKKNEWKVTEVGSAPPPRSSHQAVLARSGHGDQLWLFGGEFVSPTETQFYHYRDLWCWHFRERRWEQVKTHNGPQSRSGHRMVLWRKSLFVFGGFNDNGRSCRYFNDLWQFDLAARHWLEMLPARGCAAPSPRSACLLLPAQDGKALYVLGGFSRSASGKQNAGDEQGTIFADLHQITVPGDKAARDGDAGATAVPGPAREVRWRSIKWSGAKPDPVRSGMGAVCGDGVPGGGAVLFGGVHDDYEDVETVHSRFFNDLFRLDLERGRWSQCGYRRRKEDGPDGDADGEAAAQMEALALGTGQEEEEEAATVVDDGVFTLTVGGGPVPEAAPAGRDEANPAAAASVPRGRMNCGMAVIGHRLFVYGGQIETDKKVCVLDDLHSLDLHRMDAWQCLSAGSQERWVGQDSSDSEMDDDDDDDDDDDELLLDAPAPLPDESFTAYWSRNESFWCNFMANEMLDSDDEEGLASGNITRLAMKMAKDFHKDFASQH